MNVNGTSHRRLKQWTAALALLLAFSALALPRTVQADEEWDRWQAADAAVAAGNLTIAVPNWKYLAELYASRGDWENAALFCGNLGAYFDTTHDYDQAILYYEKENEYWLKAGKDWGASKLQRAEQLRTTIELYMPYADPAEIRNRAAPTDGN